MNKQSYLSSFALFSVLLGATHVYAGAAVVIQPVSATGVHTIVGTDIFLASGPQTVGFEFRIAGWGPQEVAVAQARFDSSGFDNGFTPLTSASVSCPSNNSAGHNFCAQTLGVGSRCNVGCPGGSSEGCHCDWGFQSTMREDYAGFGFNTISAADTSTPNFRCGLVINDVNYIPDLGVSLYLGTFYVDVPVGAQGVYDLRLGESETFLTDPSGIDIPIGLFAGARVIIGDPVAPGSRYVAYQPDEPGAQTAVRVVLTSIYHPGPPVAPGEARDFSAIEGEVRWLGPPDTFPDTAPDSSFLASQLQCTPHFADWGSMGTVQVYGDAIVPSSVYTMMQVPISCQANPNDPFCFGLATRVHTGQWGDVATPYARSDQAAQPDMTDIAVIVDAFRGIPGATPKALTQLRGAVPDPATLINFADVQHAVYAVMGFAYPYPVPASCP